MPEAIDLVVTAPLLPALTEALQQRYRLHALWQQADPAQWLKLHASGVRGLVTTGGKGADASLIGALPSLEVIACFGVGVDAIDLAAAGERGISVSNTPDVLNDCVADAALGLLLAVARRLPEADRFVRNGQWPHGRFGLGTGLAGKRCGILGLGPIGLGIARRAESFGMNIAYCTRAQRTHLPYQYCASPLTLAQASDVLILAVPGGPQTQSLIGAAELAALGPDGILVNVARGSVVDQGALIDALQTGRIKGAGLDVFADEPHVPQALCALDTVVLTPHLGSATEQARAAMAARVLDNLAEWFSAGRVLHPVLAA